MRNVKASRSGVALARPRTRSIQVLSESAPADRPILKSVPSCEWRAGNCVPAVRGIPPWKRYRHNGGAIQWNAGHGSQENRLNVGVAWSCEDQPANLALRA